MAFKIYVNGNDISDLITITDVDRGGTPELIYQRFKYKHVDGIVMSNPRYEAREITIDFRMYGNLEDKRLDLIKRLRFNNEIKLEFEDQPNIEYTGRVIGSLELDKETATFAKGSFTVLCANPFALSKQVFTGKQNRNTILCNVKGTANTYPRFEFTANSNMTMFAFVSPTGRVIQYGSEGGDVVILVGDVVRVFGDQGYMTVNGNRVYATGTSDYFHLEANKVTQIGVLVNAGSSIPNVKTTWKEAYL